MTEATAPADAAHIGTRAGTRTRERSVLSRLVFAFLGLVLGICAGVLGLMPWLLGGGTLPLQNLWATTTLPEDMPFALLPVNQYMVTTLFVLVFMGGAFAGLTMTFIRRRTRFPAWPVAAGLLIAHAIAVVQTFAALSEGLGLASDVVSDRRADLYFEGMLSGVIFLVVVSQACFWLASRRSVGVVAVTIGFVTVPLGSWIALIVLALVGPSNSAMSIMGVLRWLPALVIGATLIWCGIRPARRTAVWVVVLATILLLPPLVTAVQYALENRVPLGSLAEMSTVFSQIFPRAVEATLPPVLVALAIGIVGTFVREAMRRRRMPVAEWPMPPPPSLKDGFEEPAGESD